MKKILSLILSVLLISGLAACDTAKNTSSDLPNISNAETIAKYDIDCNVYALKGPTGIGLVSLMEKAKNGQAHLNYTFNLVGANDEIVAKVSNGEANIAAVATNVASTLYNKTNGGISVLAINTEGVLTVVAKGEEISSIKDLKGKTVYSTGQGANPEFIAKYILEKNGLEVDKDVTLEFVAEPQMLVQKVVSNEKAVVIAPQPVATAITVKDQNAKIVIDINEEWNKVGDTSLVMGCIIARNDYIKKNPKAIETFLKEYKLSIEDVNNNIDSAAALCDSYGIVTPAPVAKKAIPYCNIVFQDGKELKTNLSAYLNFLYEKAPKTIGGALPKDDFYYGTN